MTKDVGDTIDTFVMVRRQNGEQFEVVFARQDNGMIVGAINGTNFLAHWGVNPRASRIRAFITFQDAVEWVKVKCREYAGREDVTFLGSADAPKILTPTNIDSRDLRAQRP